MEQTNFLFITADDMNYDSPGACGCEIKDITPNIDRLAAEGIRFEHAHVTIAVCQPSRECLMTGRYPHRNGGEGFEPIDLDVATLQEVLHEAGYLNGILGKESHLMPVEKFCWDTLVRSQDMCDGKGIGRNPSLYYKHAREFFGKAGRSGKPFFLMANSNDPHRPFAGSDQEKANWGDALPAVRKTIKPAEVEVPGFLPDIPEVRREVAEYFSSVHRCDESVGAVLQALKETGFHHNTLVMFLSDNGMAFPFAKTNCYLASTKTPWIARFPGRGKPGLVDREHFISGIDFMPTILDAAGLPQIPGMDGDSFLPVLTGHRQEGRDTVFTEFHQTSARKRYPMRCVQDKKFGYIFNFWSDRETAFRNESQSGRTFKAMQKAADQEQQIAHRVDFFLHRVPEELYHMERDPDCLNNLAHDPEYSSDLERMRNLMLGYMQQTGDPALEAFENRNSPEITAKFMKRQREKAELTQERSERIRRQSKTLR